MLRRDLPGPSPRASCRAWCPRNIRRGVTATLVWIGALAVPGSEGAAGPGGVAIGAALGSRAARSPTAAVGAAQDHRRSPAAEDVTRAYTVLRRWVRDFEAPGLGDPAAQVPIGGASAVCVILRRSGRVVGIGTDPRGDALMVRRAAGRALGQVLGDRAVANLPVELRPDFGAGLTVELEVAGLMVPMPGRTFARMAERLEPGLDGIAMRRDNSWAMIFPAQMRATNTAGNVERLLPGMAVELGLAAQNLRILKRDHGVVVYAFRTIHLAQRRPDRPPFETFRGGVIVPEAAVTARAIVELADGIARHLLTTVWPQERPQGLEGEYRKPLGVMGDYRPVADQYRPPVAPPRDQALAAVALIRYSEAPGVDAATAEAAATAALQILRDLAKAADRAPEATLASPAACAAVVYAILERSESPDDAALDRLLRVAADRVLVWHRAASGPDESATPAVPLPAHGQALVAAAVSRMLLHRVAGVDAAMTRVALDAAWESVPEPDAATLMPWVGWAETEYAAATGHPPARVEALRRLRSRLDQSRIGSESQPGPPDVHGAFALRMGPASPSRATAQAVRPAAYLAAMLRDPLLTPPAERAVAIGRHLRTMRFLMQLAVEEGCGWAFRNPRRAEGGLRAAPWDSDQPVGAQALGLIAASETLLSLEILARNR